MYDFEHEYIYGKVPIRLITCINYLEGGAKDRNKEEKEKFEKLKCSLKKKSVFVLTQMYNINMFLCLCIRRSTEENTKW